jgi:tetratricopeptide (TPR) repeat protein
MNDQMISVGSTIRRFAAIAALSLASAPLAAQTSAEHIALGDRERDALNAVGALQHYLAAVQADTNNAEAWWRASSQVMDLGEFDDAKRDSLYRLGEQYARRAVAADAKSAMAHFALAKAVGRRAQSVGPRDRVKFAGTVRAEALESLRLDSLNAGGLHVMGVWHAEVMRLNGFARFMAKNVLGGKVFGEANWRDAARYLERAALVEPERIVHRLELGSVYLDTGDKVKAREQFEAALRLRPTDYNDKHYQQEAGRRLASLR